MTSNLVGHRAFLVRAKLIPPMDVKYESQGCLMEQRQMRLVNLIEFWGLTLNSSTSGCAIGEFNVGLFCLKTVTSKI